MLISQICTNFCSTKKPFLLKIIFFILISFYYCESYSQTRKITLAAKTTIVNPAISVADFVPRCADDGEEFPKIFLCGDTANREITTNIPNATVTWQKLDEGSCTAVTNTDCPNKSKSCTWNQVGTNTNFTVSSAGEYRIEVVFTDNSYKYFYFNVYTNPLEIPVTKTDILCGRAGKITVTKLTGYQYSLDGSTYQDSNVFDITTPKNYRAYVRRTGAKFNECVFTIPDIVISEKNLSVICLPVQPKCNSDNVNSSNSNLSKGAIKLTASNANGQYYYKITQFGNLITQFGPTTLSEYTFTDINTGTYSWEVKTDDCSVFQRGTVTLTAPISIESNIASLPITTTAPGSIVANPTGGKSPYTYYLGSTLVSSNVIPITVPGSYTVKVEDSNGCYVNTPVSVTNQPEPAFTISNTNAKCYGDKAEIKFNVTNENGNNLEFSIDNGKTFSNNPTFSNLPAGTYKAVLKYTFGTLVSTTPFQEKTITQPITILTATGGVSELSGCGPTPNTNYGKLHITNPQGGTAPYLYSFDSQATWDPQNFAYKAPGTYTLYVKDANGCIFAKPDVILEDTVVPTIELNNDSFNCDGTANNTVKVTSSEAANYTYAYSLDGGTRQDSNILTGITPGNHTLTVYSTPKIVYSYNELLKEDFGYGADTALNPAPNYCFEDQLPETVCGTNAFIADGEYSVTSKVNYPFGGAWYPVTDHTPTTTPLKTQGRFLVVNVKAETNYPILYEKTISSITPNQDIKIELYATNLFSSNFSAQSPNLKIALEDSFGNEISSFNTNAIIKNQNWNFYNGVLKPGTNTSVRFVIRSFEKSDCGNDVAIDDIKVYQLPAKLCDFSKDFKFVVPSGKAFSALITAVKGVSCAGLNDGKITISAINFDTTNGYQYSIDNGTTWKNATTSPYTITGLSNPTYSVKVRYNATGACEQTLPATTIITPDPLVTQASITVPVRCTNKATLEASSTGGTQPYLYELWNQTNTVKIRAAQNSGIFTDVDAGSYIVRGLDANNCANSTSAITVTAPPAVTASIDFTNSDICFDSTNQATLVVKTTSGTAPFSYSLDGVNPQTSNTFTNVGSGWHYIKVTDSNNCVANTQNIQIGDELKAQAVLTKSVDCTSSPNAVIKVTFEGGVRPLRYHIKKGSSIITPSEISILNADLSFTYSVSEADAGAYSFIIKDSEGCSKTTEVINVNTKIPPVISLTQDKYIMCNDEKTASIKVDLNPTTGVSPFTYEVRNTSSSVDYGSQLSGLPVGNYSVKVTDSKSCTDTKTITILEPAKLVVETANKPIKCGVSTGEIIVKKVTGGVGPYNYYLKGSNGDTASKLNNTGNDEYSFPISNFGIYEITVVDSKLCSVLTQNILIASPPKTLKIYPSTATIDCSTLGTAKVKINSTEFTSPGPFYFSIYKGVNPVYPSGTWQPENATGSKESDFTGLLRGVKYTFLAYDINTNCYVSEKATDADVIPTDSKLVATIPTSKNSSCKGAGDGKVSFKLTSNYTTDISISYQIYDALSIEPVGLLGTGTILANSDLTISDFGILPIGNYFVLIKETSGTYAGCSIATESFNITESLTDLSVPVVTPVKNANCKENGVFTFQTTGGTGPYQYKISLITVTLPIGTIPPPPPSALGVWTSSNSFSAVAGTYDVFVKDAYGCIKQTTHTVTKDPEPKINLSVTDKCVTEGNFEIIVGQTAAGIAPYYLSVNGSALKPAIFPYTLSNQNSGPYSILVQDINGCTDTKSLTIASPLSLSSKVLQLPSCYINDGKFDVFATGGSGNYQYQLNGGTTLTTSSFIGLGSGVYTVKVTDLDTNCTESISVTLEGATQITDLKYTQTDVSCKGGSNGIITATIATPAVGVNDNPIYKYSLNGGTPQESNVFSGLIAGNYTLKVISARGCEASPPDPVKIIERDAIVVSTLTPVQYNCGVTNSMNFATVNVSGISGGSENYVQYDFIKNGTLIKTQTNPTYIETDLLGGVYTVNVYDNNGCIGSSISPVTIKPFIELEKIKVTVNKAIDCNLGENITVTVQGKPTNPTNLEFTLLAKSGALLGTPSQVNTNGVFVGLPVGDYSISVKNLDTNCHIGEVYYVTEPNTFDLVQNSKTDVICFGTSTGSLQLSLIDKSKPSRAGAFSYQIKDSLGNTVGLPVNSSSTNTVSITGLKAGVYTITASLTSSPFCTVSNIFTISEPSEALKINRTYSDITCVVGNNDGTISATASGGWPGAYQFQLQSNVGPATPWSAATDFKDLTAANYTIKVRDFKGCEVSSLPVSLSIPNAISFSANTDMNMLNCKGDQSATITVSAPTGGRGSNYSYILNQISPKTVTSFPQISNQFQNLAAGTYTVTVTDPWSCKSTTPVQIEIKEPNKLEASLSTQTVQTCAVGGELKLVASGGTAPYTYSADGVTYSSTPFTTFSVIPVVGSGKFNYTIKDSKNCQSNVSNAIMIDPFIGLRLTLDPVLARVNCKGESTAEISVTPQGGIGNYEYTLLNQSGGVVRPAQASNIFSDLPAGKYTVKGQSADCIAKEDITIEEPTLKFSADYIVTPSTCAGFSNGSIKVVTVGGTGLIKQSISPYLSQLTESNLFEKLPVGTYDLLVQDALGCYQTTTQSITEPTLLEALTIASSIVQEICTDDKKGAFSIMVSGGTLPYSVSLDDPRGPFETGTSTQSKFDFTGLVGGKHTVYIQDANNCTFDWIVSLNESVKLNPNTVINYECVNNSPKNTVTVNLDASITDFSLLQFALDGGAYQASNEFTDVASGNHIVSVKHNNGCTKVTSGFNIINVAPLTLSLKDGEMNEIIAVAVGGSGNYQFTFDGEFNGSNPSYNYYKTQPYMVMVQDSNGCKTSVTKEFNYVDICVPNYFTPNGDGINDTWSPGCSVNYKNLSFTVFDRFGRELQIGKFGSSWDGKYKGSELPTGDYWYILKLNNPKDDREFVGHFTLYR